MEKTNFWKDIFKILLGFFIVHASANIYFAISGYYPPRPVWLPLWLPGLTPGINIIAMIFGLIFIGVAAYLLFLKKGSEKISRKDVSKMFIGVFFLGFMVGLAMINWFVVGVNLILFLIFIYLNFK